MGRGKGLKLNLLAGLVFLSGCGWMNSDNNIREFASHIEVTHLGPIEGQNTWHVKYTFSEPINGVVFRRQRTQFRTSTWRPTNTLMKVGSIQNHEVIYSSGGPMTQLELDVTPYFTDTPRDYEFFVPFSDGSMALYSGHFDVRPLFCPGMRFCQPSDLMEKGTPKVSTKFTFTPAAGESVIVTDDRSSGSVDWASEREGRYVYFGNIAIQDTPQFKVVFDPRLPTWVQKKVTKTIPPVLNFYAARTGFNLEAKPIVLFSFADSTPYTGTRGGVLHHQVRLTVFGSQWVDQTDENVTDLTELVSHELAHLWNGDLFFPSNGDTDAWMHEGGADAFAYRAMLSMGAIDKYEFLSLLTKALNRCIIGLNGTSLRGSDALSRYRNYYACGSSIGLITDVAVNQHDGSNLFGFWSELFRNAATHGNSYSPQMYYDLLNQKSNGVAGGLVNQIVETQLNAPDNFLNEALQRYGVDTEVIRDTPPWYVAESREYNTPNFFQFISIRNYNSSAFSY